MEVIIHSTLSSAQGQVTVPTEASQTVDNLIAAFCINKGIPHRKEFVLRTHNNEELTSTKKLSTAGVHNGDMLYLGVKASSDSWACGCNQWWLLGFIALLIGLAGITAITYLKVGKPFLVYDYGVVIDAGSSHSQLYVYNWDGSKNNGTALAQQNHTCRAAGGGLSSYTDNPDTAGSSLKACLSNASDAVPTDHRSKSRVYLGATAGMRLLRERDNRTAQAIMASVRQAVSSSGFYYNDQSQVRIIAGREEGAFGWVSINYDTLTQFYDSIYSMWAAADVTSLSGALDLGGASTQITFMPQDSSSIIPDDKMSLRLYGNDYDVYTHSYNCYGLNEVFRRYLALLAKRSNYSLVIDDVCGPSGRNSSFSSSFVFLGPCCSQPALNFTRNLTFVGIGNEIKCRAVMRELFNTSCDREDVCPFNIANQPHLHGNFMAFSGFYYTMSFLNSTQKSKIVTYSDFTRSISAYCNLTWPEIVPIPNESTSFKRKACLNAVYIDTLLGLYGFSESNWQTLTFSNMSNGRELGWTLGYMLLASNHIPADNPIPRITTALFVLLLCLFLVFIALAAGFGCHGRRVNRRQSGDSQYQRMSTYGSV